VVEEIALNGGESLRITDVGEGWQQVAFRQVGDQGTGIVIGLGRTREEALESARTTLQNALNVVDLAMVRRSL
jgi:hypothetical protein